MYEWEELGVCVCVCVVMKKSERAVKIKVVKVVKQRDQLFAKARMDKIMDEIWMLNAWIREWRESVQVEMGIDEYGGDDMRVTVRDGYTDIKMRLKRRKSKNRKSGG